MKHFLFTDDETGEDFLVCACDIFEADYIAASYFVSPRFLMQYSDFEAELSGLDEY